MSFSVCSLVDDGHCYDIGLQAQISCWVFPCESRTPRTALLAQPISLGDVVVLVPSCFLPGPLV